MTEAEESTTVKVMVRVRPFNSREKAASEAKKERLQSVIKMRGDTCAVMEFGKDERGFPTEREREAFQFDHCFWSVPMDQQVSANEFADQKFVYDRSGLVAVKSSFEGYNTCIFAYGQTGSGKTHTMLGSDADPGISPRLVDDMFSRIQYMQDTAIPTKCTVECTFFEIYNEKVRDLFNRKANVGNYDAPRIRLHPTKGVFVEGLIRREVTSAAATKLLMEKGQKERSVTATAMNPESSRSHAVFQIQLQQNDAMSGTSKISTINLIDLAGSEKVDDSQVQGKGLVEAKNINKSLSTLRKVIDVLIDNSKIRNPKNWKVIPFRESVLTWVLSDSLGGNSKTMMVTAVSPHGINTEESLSTLRYALKAKAIVCNAKVNEERSVAMLDSMRDEILALQRKLKEGKTGGEPSEEIHAEIAMRQAEISKMEETQVQLKSLLDESRAREDAFQQKLKEVDQAKQELGFAVASQKRERFAAAFRNAFLITGEKKKIELQNKELDALRVERKELESARDSMSAEAKTLKSQYVDLQRTTEERFSALTKELGARDASIAQLKRQATQDQEQMTYLRDQNAQLVRKMEIASSQKEDLERRLQRLQEELLAVTSTIEREQTEKSRLKTAFESQLNKLTEELDLHRNRKDKYKQMYLEANAKAEARNTVIEVLQGDRNSFLSTIKAQQQMVEEQGSSLHRVSQERREADLRKQILEAQVTTKDEHLALMGDALREYQNAASEWMYENHVVSRELDRVNKGYSELRTLVGKPSGSANAATTSPSPRRTGSPSTGKIAAQHIPRVSYPDPHRASSGAVAGAQRTSARSSSSPYRTALTN